MRVFSTVLFMNGQPVGYDVLEEEGRKIFHPAASPDRRHAPPIMEARKQDGSWKITGTEDPELISEVTDELNRHSSFFSLDLSATP